MRTYEFTDEQVERFAKKVKIGCISFTVLVALLTLITGSIGALLVTN